MGPVEIIPTVVPASAGDVAAAAARYPFARTLHVDFADGRFAPNTTWLPQGEFAPIEGMALEAHLMMAEPRETGEILARGGFARIIGHVEAMGDRTPEVFASWRASGAAECVIGSLFDTKIEALDPFVPLCDAVLFMAITAIGVQGLPADPHAAAHAAHLHTRFPNAMIEVDGAMSEGNISAIAAAGARRFCAGSSIAKAADPEAMYGKLLALAENAVQWPHATR